MNNEKMKKYASGLYKFFGAVQKIILVAAVLIIVGSGLIYVFREQIMGIPATTVNLGNLSLSLSEQSPAISVLSPGFIILTMCTAMIVMAAAWYMLHVLRGILMPMMDGRPFEEGTGRQLRKLGTAFLITEITAAVTSLVVSHMVLGRVDMTALLNMQSVKGYTFNYSINLNFIIPVLLIFLLSFIFEYGESLQREADETL